MNTTGYIIARLALSFGIHRKTKRLSQAADEMHLLRQAEEILGEDTWEEAEAIDEVSVEYWSLRKFALKRDELTEEVRQAGDVLNSSHEERSSLLDDANQVCLTLEKKRGELIKHSEQLVAERDSIISRAKLIKRQLGASNTKISVLSLESERAEEVSLERQKIVDYKVSFLSLKGKRSDIADKIDVLDAQILEMEKEISIERKKLRNQASSAYQNIGKANRDVSSLTAQIGLIDDEMKHHFIEIGRFVSANVGTDERCTEICRQHSHLVAQMQSIRSSIALNHKLASMAGA